MRVTNILTALFIFTNTAFSQSSAAFWLAGGEEEKITTNGLIAYYDASNVDSYDPANPGSTWNDLSGNNYHVTNYGATHSTDYGGVFYFDGVDDYMVYEGDINEDVMTFSIWTKGSNITTNCIVDIDDINLTNDLKQELLFFNGVSNDQFAIQSELSGTYEITGNSSYAINENIWYYITFTYNSGTYNLYINNVLISTTTDPSADLGAFDFFFNGYIGEFFFYDRVLTSQELTDNYNATKERYISSGPIWDGTQTSLLNDYPGAAAAYSVRALNSAYTGPLMTIRRSSDNAETDIYALANGDLDEALINSFCTGTDCFVVTWYDQSGNGRDAVQTLSTDQPVIYEAVTVKTHNNKPAVFFSDALTTMLITSSQIVTNDGFGAFIVTSGIGTQSNGVILSQHSGGADVGRTVFAGTDQTDNTKPYLFFNNGTSHLNIATTTAFDNTIKLLISEGDGVGNYSFTVNQTTDNFNIGQTFTPLNTGLRIGALGNLSNTYTGYISEIIVYDFKQTGKAGVAASINDYFSIY